MPQFSFVMPLHFHVCTNLLIVTLIENLLIPMRRFHHCIHSHPIDAVAEIRRLEDFDAKIWLDFSDDLDCVVEG